MNKIIIIIGVIVVILLTVVLVAKPEMLYNVKMKGYIINIEKESIENENYRKVLYTTPNSQLVLMSLKPGEEIGAETHQLDQFIRVEKGSGQAIFNNVPHEISDGTALVVPAGILHNIVNTGNIDLKLYIVYSPPNHKDGTIHPTKADEIEEHFDGKTSE